MKNFHASNGNNESYISFVTDETHRFDGPWDFYAAATRFLWDGWDSEANTTTYITNAHQTPRLPTDLEAVIVECLEITPMPDFTPELGHARDIYSFRDDWNVKEYVWRTATRYWLMAWGTSA